MKPGVHTANESCSRKTTAVSVAPLPAQTNKYSTKLQDSTKLQQPIAQSISTETYSNEASEVLRRMASVERGCGEMQVTWSGVQHLIFIHTPCFAREHAVAKHHCHSRGASPTPPLRRRLTRPAAPAPTRASDSAPPPSQAARRARAGARSLTQCERVTTLHGT